MWNGEPTDLIAALFSKTSPGYLSLTISNPVGFQQHQMLTIPWVTHLVLVALPVLSPLAPILPYFKPAWPTPTSP